MRPAAAGALVTLVLAVVAAGTQAAWAQFPVPQPSQPQPPAQPQPSQSSQPAADPRLAQIKTALEGRGLRVLEVVTLPQRGNAPGGWAVVTQATYAQPSFPAIAKQALDVWWAMYAVLSQEPPVKRLVSANAWNKYELQVWSRVGEYAQFLSAYRSAQTDAQRADAFKGLFDQVDFRVWDNETGRFVDEKDFVNKNFAR